jgi:phospholipase DDHD1
MQDPEQPPPMAVTESDRCLLRMSALLALSQPDAAGFLHKRASISGWYRFWFSLHGSQLRYFEVATDGRRGPLAGVISLFRNTVSVPSMSASKRKREVDLVDAVGKSHVLRADSDAQLHWWIQVFAIARNKIPPAKPFVPIPPSTTAPAASIAAVVVRPALSASPSPSPSVAAADNVSDAKTDSCKKGRGVRKVSSSSSTAVKDRLKRRSQSLQADAGDVASTSAVPLKLGSDETGNLSHYHRSPGPSQSQKQKGLVPPAVAALQSVAVEEHLPVDHVLCVVHGIGASDDVLSENISQLKDTYTEVSSKIFPDLNFRVELLVVHWRHALTSLDVHKKLQAVVPIAPNLSGGEANPLRQFMVHRAVDYVYYTHDRYRRHILREVAAQLNASIADFRRRRPDFDGHVSIFAHSLGAALTYDLLCRKEHDDRALLAAEGFLLDFEVSNLFMGGSPLGTFLHLDPSLALGADIRKLPFRIFNIYHPNDPIATRLEPYMDPRFVGVTPVVIPYWFNMGIRSSTAQWLGTLWGGKQKATATTAATTSGESTTASIAPAGAATSRCSPTITSVSTNDGGAEGEVGVVRKLAASTGGLIRPGSSRVGPGCAGDETDLAAEMAMIGLSGYESELHPRYFSQAAQDEIRNSLGEERRFDYVLQLSSTMEEVSTAWSALRAHTYYWGSIDMMLLMLSSMMKTTHGIPDNVSQLPSLEVDMHLIDSRAHMKPSSRFGRSWLEDGYGDVESTPGFPDFDRRAGSSQDAPFRDDTLEGAVQSFVDKLVDEAASMHDLGVQHPHMRMRWGGITRSTSGPNGQAGATPVEALRRAASRADGGGQARRESEARAGYAGWASYIPWFGKEDAAKAAGAARSAKKSSGRN